jgi:hypothetical protein
VGDELGDLEDRMPQLRLKRPSHTTVVAYLSLFLVLTGGTALAVKLKANKVKSKHIAPDAVLGVDVNESTLGEVPSAANAKSADRANSAATADTAGSAPPSGEAGGALAGSYPSPGIASNAVGAGEIQDPVRSVHLPLASFLNRNDGAALDFTPSNGTSPDFTHAGNGLVIEWDPDSDAAGGDLGDTDFVETTFTVPPDYASGGVFAARISKSGNAPTDERFTCARSFDDSASGNTANVVLNFPEARTYPVSLPANYSAGVAVAVYCTVSDLPGGSTYDDAVRLHAFEFRYSASQ